MATKKPTAEPTLGALIDELYQWKDQKKAADAVVKEIDERIKEREQLLLGKLEEAGMDKASGKVANIAMRVSVVPVVADWDLFYKYIGTKKAYHLLERRPSATGCREIFEGPAGKNKIPGVDPYDKVSLSVTAMRKT